MTFQKNFIKNSNLLIIEGRDIGSKILGSKADLKLFLLVRLKQRQKGDLKNLELTTKKLL